MNLKIKEEPLSFALKIVQFNLQELLKLLIAPYVIKSLRKNHIQLKILKIIFVLNPVQLYIIIPIKKLGPDVQNLSYI